MKKFIIFYLVLFTPLAFGLNFVPKPDRDIFDLMYLPLAGTSFGQSDFNFDALQYELKPSGVHSFDADQVATSFTQSIGHSFGDRFSIAADINYLVDTTTTFNAKDGMNDFRTTGKGLGDPSITVRYRLLEERNAAAVNLDVIPRGTLKTGESDLLRSDEKSSNNKLGHSSYGLLLQVGKQFTEHQWLAYLSADRIEEESGRDPGNSAKTISASYFSYDYGGQYQLRMNEKWHFNIGIGATRKPRIHQRTGNLKATISDQSSFRLSPELIWQSSAELAVFLRYDIIGYSRRTTKTSDGTVTVLDDIGYGRLAVCARYQF